jgi:NAD(P)-dependent dehydrogenase (short-subunit alcohol dehydrogenase family)
MTCRMCVDLTGRAGIITGAAAGMGREIAVRLGSDGASLILADRDFGEAVALQDEINGNGGHALALKTDVSDEKNVQAMVEHCMSSYSKIDFLVSNAGVVGPYTFDETSSEEWDNVFAINTKGGFLCAKYALPHMQRQKSGRILFTASTNGGKPGGYVIAYRASKAALIMFARSLALYAAPYGITVNAICPVVTMTPMQRTLTEDLLEPAGMIFEGYVEERKKRVPMGRFTSVKDIADVTEFLISDNASFITGQAIYVNGGEW